MLRSMQLISAVQNSVTTVQQFVTKFLIDEKKMRC